MIGFFGNEEAEGRGEDEFWTLGSGFLTKRKRKESSKVMNARPCLDLPKCQTDGKEKGRSAKGGEEDGDGQLV